MLIQSLSICVPGRKCINACKMCVSRMRNDEYRNQMDCNLPFYDLYLKDYLRRLEFARDNGCNTVMLTGNLEPQQNRIFLTQFGLFMMLMERPFRNVEMQTTGVLLDEAYLRFLRNHVGVSTISLSLTSFNSRENDRNCGMPINNSVEIEKLCALIKKYDFTLRLSLNMTSAFTKFSPESLFDACWQLGANQVTLRVLYESDGECVQNDWIRRHRASDADIGAIEAYIKEHGRELEVLEFGSTRYSVNGMSVVLDDDCMNTEAKKTLKYAILRPDCKLYTKWDDPGSLLF